MKQLIFIMIFLTFSKKNDCFDKFKNNWYNLKRRSCRGFNREYNNLELYLIPADKISYINLGLLLL